MFLEISDDPGDLEAGVLGSEYAARLGQRHLIDVESHVATKRAGARERAEQEPGLLRGPGAELDQRRRAGQPGEAGGFAGEDGPLRAGRVVLGEPGDLIEELTAALVVEPLGRQGLRLGRQAGEYVSAQRLLDSVGRQVALDVGLLIVVSHASPRSVTETPSGVAVSRLRSGMSRQAGSSS